jgi:ribosomal protein S18 acetylase RimI-like enzyme
MEAIDIRAASEADREWAIQLMARSEPWVTLGRNLELSRKACTVPNDLLYVAYLGGSPCSFMLMRARGLAGSPYIPSLAVDDGHRGRGIGQRMLQFAEDYYRADFAHIFLCVSSFNTRARVLYERVGYRAVGELQDYIIRGASEIVMHKRLR